MPWRTVEHWLHDRTDAKPKAVLRPVTVTPSVEHAKTVIVHGPRGLRIEGLDVRQIAELLARLG
jgi:hypothetical protein